MLTSEDVAAVPLFSGLPVRLSPVKRVAAAVGEGSMAIALVLHFLANAGRAEEPAE